MLTQFSLACRRVLRRADTREGWEVVLGRARLDPERYRRSSRGRGVTCKATIGGAAVPVKAKRLRNGVAACVWSLPRSASGKQLKGSVSVTTKGVTASRSFVARVS